MIGYLRFLRKVFFTKHFKLAFGHFGDDIAVRALIRETLGKSALKSGFYVDVGAFHPTKHSNTYAFYRRGWSGIVVDLEPAKLAAFRLLRPRDIRIQAAVSDEPGSVTLYGDFFSPYTTARKDIALSQGRYTAFEVPARTLSDIIDATPFRDREIDLLDVDCEGMDLNVLRSLDFARYRPKIICVEIHAATIPAVMQGETHAFLTAQSYDYVNRVGPTSIYVRSDLIAAAHG